MASQIDDGIDSGMTFWPGQLFVFGSLAFHADSAGHLGQIKTFAPGRIVRFGNLEYVADDRGELAFLSWVSDQVEKLDVTSTQTSESIQTSGHDETLPRIRSQI